MKSAIAFLLIMFATAEQRKPGNPLDHLPKNIQILTRFGERADFSPDNKSIAFMAKSFGDAMVIDLKTRDIRCLTCNVPGAAFLRVMHLSTGDYDLILLNPVKWLLRNPAFYFIPSVYIHVRRIGKPKGLASEGSGMSNWRAILPHF